MLNDKVTNAICTGSAICFILLVVSLAGSLIYKSKESISQTGINFITKSTWNAKFLELSRVNASTDESFTVFFTVPVDSSQSFADLIAMTYNQQSIAIQISQSNHIITITPEYWRDGDYTISISQSLQDTNHYALPQDITWSGQLSNNRILSPQIVGAKTGIIDGVIESENTRHFMILPFIIGTLVSSILALLIAFPIALAVALLVIEYAPPTSPIIKMFTILIDLLAGIPSVIYGLWGLFFLVPKLGANILTASIVLSIMIMPYAASLSREAISLVPNKLKQAGLGLGASRLKVIQHIVLPYARSGIIAGILLTLGRALGETLAVTMVIGNRNQIPTSIFDPAQTISSLIANEYGEASGLKQSALIEAGFVLMIIVLCFSLLGRIIIRYQDSKSKQGN